MKTSPQSFIDFHILLMANAPKDYTPWYFPVVANNKAPDGLAIAKRAPKEIKENRGNWKADWARLSYEEAIKRLKEGGNVGLSARANDPLVIIDIDNYDLTKFMPDTLIVKSRKRCGLHGFCWAKDNSVKVNIPTSESGEVRSSDQYVVACGSYCETSEKDIDNEPISNELKEQIKKDIRLGCYTLEINKNPIQISFDELPLFFKERKIEQQIKPKIKTETIQYKGKHSALYDLTIQNIVSIQTNKREPHPLHASDTGMNFSINGDLAHCWRHLVSLNAIQFLVVKSGYKTCDRVGTLHKGGSNYLDDGDIFYAWLEAKKCNLIPKDDPIPVKAMLHIAKEEKLVEKSFEGLLPDFIYNYVLRIVEEKY